MNLSNKLLACLCLVAGLGACSDNDEVIATGVAGNDFFVQWQIASDAFDGTLISCDAAGASRVDMTVFKEETGTSLFSSFDCNAYQGLSLAFETGGHYDIQLDLVSPTNALLASESINDQDITISGTVDLGLVTFEVP